MPLPLPPFRRIVTGHDATGRAIVSSDGPPLSIPLAAVPGTVMHEVWNTGPLPVALDNGADPVRGPLTLAPPALGSRIRVVDIPPDSIQQAISPADAAAAFAQLGAHGAATGHANGRHRLMHRTETLDYGIVIHGELWLVLDDGEVRLQPGDIVIQRGTNHAWSNRTDAVARIAFILLDGRHAPDVVT
jgi:hypothetical protein